jgi:hypothetical protein
LLEVAPAAVAINSFRGWALQWEYSVMLGKQVEETLRSIIDTHLFMPFFLMVRGQLFVFDTTNFEKMLVGSETNALIYPRHNYNLSLSWF